MINFKQEIANEIAFATKLEAKELIKYIEEPPNSDLGDYAFPCFRLAKELKKSPQAIALDILENISKENIVIDKIAVDGGYLNFYINKVKLFESVFTEFDNKKEEYGSLEIGKGKNVVVDYSSPNIAKPFHIGHLRSTVIGGSIYNIHKKLRI